MAKGVSRTVEMGRRFLRQAESDIMVAGTLERPGSYYVAANLAHQATEKALKAAHWHLVGREPAWRHGLMALADSLVSEPEEIPSQVREAISLLAPIFEHSRYPSGNVNDPIPAEAISADIAQNAVLAAKEVMEWVTLLLQEPPNKLASETN